MSFGNAKIFPFPAVQYIPLTVKDIQRGQISQLNTRTERCQLIIGEEISKWRDVLTSEYGIPLDFNYDSNALPIIALNLTIEDVKYRGFYVTMNGKKTMGSFHYCTIPKNYFYKKNLFFELYDTNNGERLAHLPLNKW